MQQREAVSVGGLAVWRSIMLLAFLWVTCATAQEDDNAVVLDAEQATTFYARAEAMTHGLTNSFRAFYSLDRLVRDFQLWQNLGVAIAPPSTNAFFIHRNDFHVFDPTGFPVQVLSGLIPETYRGGMATVYRVFVGEDPYTRDRVIYNAEGQALWYQPPPEGYDPWRYLRATRFWALESDTAQAETLRAIHDPSRIWCEYLLLPLDNVPDYASAWAYAITTNRIATLSATANMSMMAMSSMSAPAADAFVFTDFTFTNGIADMEIHLPDGLACRVDVFYTLLLTNAYWSLATTTPTNFGTFRVQLACSASNLFFRAGNADVDNDGDGLPDDRETLMYGTDPTKWDTDGDGLSDGYEIANGLNPLKRDTDGDGTDDDELVLAGVGGVASTASIRYYYDGDDRLTGTYAGSGSGGGANTIANTAAGNTSTAAERSTP